MKRRLLTHLAIVTLTLSAVLLLGCTSESGDPEPTASPETTAVGPPPVPTFPGGPPGPPPTPDLSSTRRVPSTVVLVDVKAGSSLKPYENLDETAFSPQFDGASVTYSVREGGGDLKFVRVGLDGKELERRVVDVSSPDVICRNLPAGAELNGRLYADARCGLISPDEQWMLYPVQAGQNTLPSGYVVPVTDEWIVNLATGDRHLLQQGLVGCGGCDGRYGPKWSPSGRFVYFGETGGEGRTFLADLQRGTTRLLTSGSTNLQLAPDWRATGNVILYRGDANTAVLEDLDAGARMELTDIAWPARFDPSGRYVYSPSWSDSRKTTGGTTVVYDVQRRQVVATLEGQPAYMNLFALVVPVVGTAGGFVAALENGRECAGVTVYTVASLRCVVGASMPSVSPDGRTVAMVRKVGDFGQYRGPNNTGASNGVVYELVLVDITTSTERVVQRDVISTDLPPIAVWNEASTHVLLAWPASYGL